MEGFLANMYIYIYTSLFAPTATYEKLSLYSDAIQGALTDTSLLHTTYVTVRTLAFGMLAVYFIITLGTRFEGKEISPSVVFKTGLEFFVGYCLAFFSFDIVSWLFTIGDWLAELLLEDIMSKYQSLEGYFDAFKNALSDVNFISLIGYLFRAFFAYIICLVANMAIMYTIITRVIRICVSAAMSPFVAANYFDGTRRSDAVKFLKKTLSMCLQCSMIMVLSVATASMADVMTEDKAFSSSMENKSALMKAGDELIESKSIDGDKIANITNIGVNKYNYINQGMPGADKTQQAFSKLNANDIEEIPESKESEYMEYEDVLGVEIFERTEDGSHYEYTDDNYIKIKGQYYTLETDKVKNFMDIMLGKGHYMIFVLLMVARVGLIKKSNSLCNTIVGL